MNETTLQAGQKVSRDSVGRGVLIVLLWNLCHVVVGIALSPTGYGVYLLVFFGFLELVYVVPLAVHAARVGRRKQMKGIIITGIVEFLLTTGLLALIFFTMPWSQLR